MDQIPRKFPYWPLDATKHEIRLIRLQPRLPSSDVIKCELLTANLDHEPRYEALSYEWGSSRSKMLPITVDGQDHIVRKNLWYALYHLRDKRNPRILWIDALSINQKDVKERNHQVAQMGMIYSRASKVIAWIGVGKRPDPTWSRNDGQIAADLLHDLNLLDNRTGFARLFRASRDRKAILDPPKRELDALSGVFFRNYWTRLWIIQELVLASKVSVQCGSAIMDLDLLGLVSKMEYDSKGPTSTAHVALCFSRPMNLLQWRRERIKKLADPATVEQSLLGVIRDTSGANCDDVRDKVFGVLNLSPVCCQSAVPPNYSESFTEICEKIILHHVSHHPDDGSPNSITRDLLTSFRLRFLKRRGDPWPRIHSDTVSLTKANHAELITMSGSFKGRILWTFTPPDQIISAGEHSSVRVSPLPDLDESILCPLMDTVIGQIRAHEFPRGEPLEGEVLWFDPESQFSSISSTSRAHVMGPDCDVGPQWDSEKEAMITPKKVSSTQLHNVLQESLSSLVDNLKSQKLSIFFTDKGGVGFATFGCKVGDILCQGPDGFGRVAIVDTVEPPHNIVGKGILLDDSEPMAETLAGAGRVEMHLDMATLLFLNGYF